MSSPFKTWHSHLPVAREKIFVLRHQGKWQVRYREKLYGPYLIPGDAMRRAIERAYRIGRRGSGAQVFVQVKGEEFRLEWTYGLDPYPEQA